MDLRVTTEEIRPDTDEEPGCYAVRVGDRLLGFERNQVNADLRARALREVIRDARAQAFREHERLYESDPPSDFRRGVEWAKTHPDKVDRYLATWAELRTAPERPLPGK